MNPMAREAAMKPKTGKKTGPKAPSRAGARTFSLPDLPLDPRV
jgi:hypothetical protein